MRPWLCRRWHAGASSGLLPMAGAVVGAVVGTLRDVPRGMHASRKAAASAAAAACHELAAAVLTVCLMCGCEVMLTAHDVWLGVIGCCMCVVHQGQCGWSWDVRWVQLQLGMRCNKSVGCEM